MCLNHRLYRAEMAEIYFFNFLLFSGNKTGTSLLAHGTKKQRRREGISGNTHAVFRDFCTPRCSKGFARGTHPHLPSLPRNCHCDCSTTVELGLMQKHREIFLKLGIMKVKVSLVTWNEKKLLVTQINIFTANVYIHYWGVLQLTVSVLQAIYR